MKRNVLTVAAIMSLAAAPCVATTFQDTARPDPFAAGAVCRTFELMSTGSYVFGYPSKYDGVFSPRIDPGFLWVCPQSGFVSFASDFETIAADSKPAVAAWLLANPASVETLSHMLLLGRAEEIYHMRGMPQSFWAWFYRVRAYWAEDHVIADAHRAKALPLLRAELGRPDLTPFDRAMTHYLVGYYSRRLGKDDESRAAFADLGRVDWSSFKSDYPGRRTKARHENIEYIAALARDVQAGKLDGACGQFQRDQPDCPPLKDLTRAMHAFDDMVGPIDPPADH